jgi:hypothetical protein
VASKCEALRSNNSTTKKKKKERKKRKLYIKICILEMGMGTMLKNVCLEFIDHLALVLYLSIGEHG